MDEQKAFAVRLRRLELHFVAGPPAARPGRIRKQFFLCVIVAGAWSLLANEKYDPAHRFGCGKNKARPPRHH
jgi:hypothetical protein